MEYNQRLFEDESTKRLDESLKLWKEIVTSRWVKDTHIVLALTKKDLFREMLAMEGFSTFHNNFSGTDDQDYDQVLAHITSMFMDAAGDRPLAACPFVVNVIDKDDVEMMFRTLHKVVQMPAVHWEPPKQPDAK